jgi:Bacterial protein of unknown function (Gcw_chp)
MQRANVLRTALVAAGAAVGVAPVQAQTTIGADLYLYSSYVWRGLSLTNKPVAQPDLYVTIPVGNASITAGGWSSIDLGKYDDPINDISESGGTSSFNFAEFDWWGEVSYPVGKATLTGGATGYIYPNDAGLTKAANTVELYAKAAVDAPLSPKVALYYDVDKIKGAYFEGGITYALPASEKVEVNLGALAGFSAGQGLKAGESANFSGNGFTHLDLSAGVPFEAGALSIIPVLHLVIAGDDFVKITSPTKTHDAKLWGGVSISWSRALGEEPEAPAAPQ